MKALFGFLPKVVGKGAAFVAQYAQKKPGETNVMGYLAMAAGAYFGVDKADMIKVLEGLISLLK